MTLNVLVASYTIVVNWVDSQSQILTYSNNHDYKDDFNTSSSYVAS